MRAQVFEAMCHDLRVILRLVQGRSAQPTAIILDARTVQSTPESGARAGFDGHKKRKGSKTHVAVDTLGHLLALHVTPANEQERAQVGVLAAAVQEATDQSVQLAFADQGYTGEAPAKAAKEEGIELEVVKLPEAKNGFVLLPRRWVVERSFGWLARCRRLARDYERLPEVFAGLHFVAFVGLLLARLGSFCLVSSSQALSHDRAIEWAAIPPRFRDEVDAKLLEIQRKGATQPLAKKATGPVVEIDGDVLDLLAAFATKRGLPIDQATNEVLARFLYAGAIIA